VNLKWIHWEKGKGKKRGRAFWFIKEPSLEGLAHTEKKRGGEKRSPLDEANFRKKKMSGLLIRVSQVKKGKGKKKVSPPKKLQEKKGDGTSADGRSHEKGMKHLLARGICTGKGGGESGPFQKTINGKKKKKKEKKEEKNSPLIERIKPKRKKGRPLRVFSR